jgi:transcriptional regulator with XRE-family HTH domain
LAAASERDREVLSLFVDEMTAMRQQRGWTQADLAREAGYSESLIAMVETYQRPPTESLALALDRAFGTPDTFRRLEARLRDLPFPAAFRPFVEYESEARSLRWFEHSLVPGLFQTPAYARAVLSTKPNTTEGEVDELVGGRLYRQKVLKRDQPPLVSVLLDEWVLNRPVAPPEVMAEQLLHLVAVSQLPNVVIQVVPYEAGGHSGLLGAFIIAEAADMSSIVFTEDVLGGHVAEDRSVVSEVTLRFDALRWEALPRGSSRDKIASVAEQWKARSARP